MRKTAKAERFIEQLEDGVVFTILSLHKSLHIDCQIGEGGAIVPAKDVSISICRRAVKNCERANLVELTGNCCNKWREYRRVGPVKHKNIIRRMVERVRTAFYFMFVFGR